MDRQPDFYLASSDYYNLERLRRAWRVKRMSTPYRNDLLLAKIDPPITYRRSASSVLKIDIVLLAARHQEASLFPITEWPLFVHVARPLIPQIENRDEVREDELENIAGRNCAGLKRMQERLVVSVHSEEVRRSPPCG